MPKPTSTTPPNASLYPEGGPGRQLKARLRAGEVLVGGIIGEMAMINSNYRSATAVALRPTILARITRDQFRDVIVKNPDAAFHVMAVLANRLRVANMLLTS